LNPQAARVIAALERSAGPSLRCMNSNPPVANLPDDEPDAAGDSARLESDEDTTVAVRHSAAVRVSLAVTGTRSVSKHVRLM